MGDRLRGYRVVSVTAVLPVKNPELPDDNGANAEIARGVKDSTGNHQV
jgi:hypothetical protein